MYHVYLSFDLSFNDLVAKGTRVSEVTRRINRSQCGSMLEMINNTSVYLPYAREKSFLSMKGKGADYLSVRLLQFVTKDMSFICIPFFFLLLLFFSCYTYIHVREKKNKSGGSLPGFCLKAE